MEETGVVARVEGATAYVMVARKGACEHCAAGTCHMTEEGALIEAVNEAGARVGQRVRVEMKPYTYLKGSLIAYGVPVAALIAGAIVGKEFTHAVAPGFDAELGSAIAGFAFLAASLLGLRVWARRAEKKVEYKSVVVEIVDASDDAIKS